MTERMPDAEITPRAELLAREILHIVRAHVDSLPPLHAGSVSVMALALALAELVYKGWGASTFVRPALSTAELAKLCRTIPFGTAAEMVVAGAVKLEAKRQV